MAGPYGEWHGRPIYRTWDDAMADPGLDLRVGFLVVDPDPPPAEPLSGTFVWPAGWTDVGATDETEQR